VLALHPVIPAGTVVRFSKIGIATFWLIPKTRIGSGYESAALDLGNQFTARIIDYDPSNGDRDFYVQVIDGAYAGRAGWVRPSSQGDDGKPIDQFSEALAAAP